MWHRSRGNAALTLCCLAFIPLVVAVDDEASALDPLSTRASRDQALAGHRTTASADADATVALELSGLPRFGGNVLSPGFGMRFARSRAQAQARAQAQTQVEQGAQATSAVAAFMQRRAAAQRARGASPFAFAIDALAGTAANTLLGPDKRGTQLPTSAGNVSSDTRAGAIVVGSGESGMVRMHTP